MKSYAIRVCLWLFALAFVLASVSGCSEKGNPDSARWAKFQLDCAAQGGVLVQPVGSTAVMCIRINEVITTWGM